MIQAQVRSNFIKSNPGVRRFGKKGFGIGVHIKALNSVGSGITNKTKNNKIHNYEDICKYTFKSMLC